MKWICTGCLPKRRKGSVPCPECCGFTPDPTSSDAQSDASAAVA